MKKRFMAIILALVMVLALCPTAGAVASTDNLILYGDARQTEDGVIELTELATWKSGSAWLPDMVNTRSGFIACFSYWAGGGRSQSYGGADGISLSFSEKPGLGGQGEYIGFVGNNSYGVELDSYPHNSGDPSGKHIAILHGSVRNHLASVADDRVDDSAWHDITVRYSAGRLDVYLDGDYVLGANEIEMPDRVYLGITAATGSGINRHLIKDFYFTDSSGAPVISVPSLGSSSIQQEVLKNKQEIADWVDRLDLPEYAETLYDVVAGDEASGKAGALEKEENFVLPQASAGEEVSTVDRIDVAEFSLLDLYTNPGAELNSAIFSDESFYTIPANAEDRKIDCTKLNVGDVVTTPNFNGVYVTKIPYDGAFDANKKEACEYIAAVYHAFDRDHPEIFWLSGKCKARIMVASDPVTKAKEAYFFLVLADKDGFTMCAPAWTSAGSVTAGIAQRDAAVAEILKTVTASAPAEQVRQLNKWLTEHNQYNTTPDLTSISNEPHESLSALNGQIGTEGPVCDGYSRAFKVLCDKLGIPCVLETGWAKSTASGTAGFHMWSLVQIGGTWYGTDITWDDPSVKGLLAANSGRENENYLLVGADTVINGLTFSQSHVVKNQAAVGGVDFNNGPAMGLQAYAGLAAQPALPTVENIPATGTAYARTQTVLLDNKKVEFQCYAVKDAKGNETNYVKIRDLANTLNSTKARFNVGWDGKISITSNTAYQIAGGEGSTPYSGSQTYKAVSNVPVNFNGSSVNLTSFSITYRGGGYTYYKLRDLGQLLNFNVKWDGSAKSVVIETDQPFTGQ